MLRLRVNEPLDVLNMGIDKLTVVDIVTANLFRLVDVELLSNTCEKNALDG